MRRCAVKTLLTHSRRIHWVLLTFVQRLLHFCEMQNMTFMSCCTRCGSNMPSWHNGKWPPSIAETFTLVWHRCWPLSWYCLSETNKRCSFVCHCMQCYCAPRCGAKYRDQCVCLSARISQNHVFKRHAIFCVCCLLPWLDLLMTTLQYVMYFRFCAWHHAFKQ